jgi:glycosyltransferase involved in cell wall biosynthesis
VIIPCHNEEATVGRVVSDFGAVVPEAEFVVVDNASTDRTAQIARADGATVMEESRPGKGNAVRRAFADVEADCYVMVDGDSTYDPSRLPEMIDLVTNAGVDMVVGKRIHSGTGKSEYRRGHQFGNRVLTGIFRRLFSLELEDTLSGFRVMSKRFVKSYPGGSVGFEIEADLNAHAAHMLVPVAEVDCLYSERPPGSESKLSTYRDGYRILRRNLRLFRDARPLLAFVMLGLPWLLLSIMLNLYVLSLYLESGLVLNFPSLIAGVGCFLVFMNLWLAGIVLERTARNRLESNRLVYLNLPSPRNLSRRRPRRDISGPTAQPTRS